MSFCLMLARNRFLYWTTTSSERGGVLAHQGRLWALLSACSLAVCGRADGSWTCSGLRRHRRQNSTQVLWGQGWWCTSGYGRCPTAYLRVKISQPVSRLLESDNSCVIIFMLMRFSALEALRNALYKFKTYLLTYLLTYLGRGPPALMSKGPQLICDTTEA